MNSEVQAIERSSVRVEKKHSKRRGTQPKAAYPRRDFIVEGEKRHYVSVGRDRIINRKRQFVCFTTSLMMGRSSILICVRLFFFHDVTTVFDTAVKPAGKVCVVWCGYLKLLGKGRAGVCIRGLNPAVRLPATHHRRALVRTISEVIQ